jgi:hypothetical protein
MSEDAKQVAIRPDVPVFNCVINVVKEDATGACLARVANLDGIEVRAPSERQALSQAVAAFKAFVSERHAQSEPIPWISPPRDAGPGEVQRLIAVHL